MLVKREGVTGHKGIT